MGARSAKLRLFSCMTISFAIVDDWALRRFRNRSPGFYSELQLKCRLPTAVLAPSVKVNLTRCTRSTHTPDGGKRSNKLTLTCTHSKAIIGRSFLPHRGDTARQ